MTACPKEMVYGPCGGVADDGRCEVHGQSCPFAEHAVTDHEVVERAALSPGAAELMGILARRPLVVGEMPVPGPDPVRLRRLADTLAGHLDAVLLGDAPWGRVLLPPSERGRIVADAGLRPWVTLNCRDRNRVALEEDLAGLAAAGIPAVHCVTGDHPALGRRADAKPVFDLDSTRLAALAAGSGLVVSVAESPAAPPVDQRPARLVAKQRAGARVCLVNHAGGPDAVAEFVGAARALGADAVFIACVPLVTSHAGLERLMAFTRGAVATSTAAAVEASDPVGAGVDAAVQTAQAMLAVDGVDGVDLSSISSPGEELEAAAAMALAGAALGAGA